ncbi:MAG: prolyl oligopeptidase family serine peptidase [Acidimicrobiia bacterium]|nr:prolyl oligopeptidase family serine peptidase [Acidimicrobiia bacterium]
MPEAVSYGPTDDQVIHLRRPAEPGPHPGVILVHGGFWRHMWTRDTMDGIAIDLARRGYVSANVEYRRVGGGGGWPETVDDVETAVRTVIEREDLSDVAVIGHSAGAQLAFMAASRLDPPPLAVSLGGVLDLEAAVSTGIGNQAAAAFLAGADPTDASPLHHPVPRAVAIHGTDDDRVPVDHARTYASERQARLVELAGTGHFEFLERSDPAWQAVVKVLERELPA